VIHKLVPLCKIGPNEHGADTWQRSFYANALIFFLPSTCDPNVTLYTGLTC
jgi:hypothetical protein